MINLWMVWRYLTEGRRFLSLTFILSTLGVALGVASLIIAMAVVSGYESTLKKSVIDLQSHILVYVKGGAYEERKSLEEYLLGVSGKITAISPLLIHQGLVVQKSKIAGVILEGLDESSFLKVMRLDRSLIAGHLKLSGDSAFPLAIIGKGLALKYSLSVGDAFNIVIPTESGGSSNQFRPKVKKFMVGGILNLGRADYDERYILMSLPTLQTLTSVGQKISGWRMTLSDDSQAEDIASAIARGNEDLVARPWRDINKNLFDAVVYERAVIFIIVLLIVIAAAFNVSSALFLSVVRRYPQIAILKTMGMSSSKVKWLFVSQGLSIALVGTILGLLLGWGGCAVFLWAEKKYGFFPGAVYKLDHVDLVLRPLDLGLIMLTTLGICFLATLAPAGRGARLKPVDGLRYE